MATNTGYLVLLWCIAKAAGKTTTVCTSNSCIDYSLNCFTNGVIAVHNVLVKVNDTCGPELEEYHCCCTNQLTGSQYLNVSALNDLRHLCDYNTSCKLWSYIYNTKWKMTVNYDCLEVIVSTRKMSSIGNQSNNTSDGAIPDTTATNPPGSETEEAITTDSSAAMRSGDNTTATGKTQDTSTVPAEVGDANTTVVEENGNEVYDMTGTFTFPILEGAIILGLCIIFIIVVTIVALIIRRRQTLHRDEHRIRLDNVYIEDTPPLDNRNYEQIDDVTSPGNEDLATQSHIRLFSEIRRHDYDRVVLNDRKNVRSDRTYDHIRHCGNRTNQQILHVTKTAYIPAALDN